MNPLIAQLQQLVRDYLATRNDALLVTIGALAAQLVNQVATLSDLDRQAVFDALRTVLGGLSSPLAAAPLATAAMAAPLAFAPPPAALLNVATAGGLGLLGGGGAAGTGLGLAGGGAAPGGTVVVAPGSVSVPGFGGAVVSSGAALGLGVAAIVIATIALQIFLLSGLTIVAPLVVIATVTRLSALSISQIVNGVRVAVASETPVGAGLCFSLAFNRLVKDVDAAFGKVLADAIRGVVAIDYRESLFQKIWELIEKFLQDLTSCGFNRADLIAKIASIKQLIKIFFKTAGANLSAGPAIPLALLQEARNGFRNETLEGNVSGFHRKGGLGYEEVGDDRAATPDISNEDERTPVPLEEADVDPNLDLDAFTTGQIGLRKETLTRYIQELMGIIAGLDADIAPLRGSADPGDQDRLGRLLVARDEAVRELRKMKAALRNAHVELQRRAAEEGLGQQADDILEATQFIDTRNPEREFSTAIVNERRAALGLRLSTRGAADIG